MAFHYSNNINKANNASGFDKIKSIGAQDPVNAEKKDKRFFCSLGDSFMLKNEYRKAVKEYLVSIMIDKNNIPAYKGVSSAYKNLREYDKAIKHLKNARNIYSFDSEIYYELGLNYLLNADNANAQKNFIRTIKLSPDNKNAQIKLALTHELSGEDDMAIMVYLVLIEKYPYYIPAYASLAGLYIQKEDYKSAASLYKKILKINPEYYRAYLGLGLCFDKSEKYSAATRFYKKYISFKPNSLTTKSLVGRIYEIRMKLNKKLKAKKSATSNKLKLIQNESDI